LKVVSLALLLSGGSVVLTQQWLHQAVRRASLDAAAKAGPATATPAVQVLVAAVALPPGTIVKPGQLRWQPWPAGIATGDFLTQANTRIEDLNGAVARGAIAAGEPLSTGRLVQPGDRGFLAAVLKPGFRAVTVNVTAASGVAGFVVPGDHVDVILNMSQNSPDGDHRVGSVTILQDVRVLAMDQRAAESATPAAASNAAGNKDGAKTTVAVPQTATLEVTPKAAEIIGAAMQVAPLTLSLRSLAEPGTPAPLERTVTHTSIGEALGVAQSAPAPRAPASRAAARPAGPSIQLFRGSQAVTVATGAAS
jgi:pilus assembly protein CpaB